MDQKSKTQDIITLKRPTLTLKLGNSPLLKKIELLKAKTAVVATNKESTNSKKPPTSLSVASEEVVLEKPATLPKPIKKDKNKKDTNKIAKVAAPELAVKESKKLEPKEDAEKKEGSDSENKENSSTKKKAKKPYKNNKAKKKQPVQVKKLLMSKERYGTILLDLQQRYPDCFSKPTKPLAVGIHFELRETGLYSRSVIWDFLKVYCLMSQYKACLEPGRERVNLDGSVSSIV